MSFVTPAAAHANGLFEQLATVSRAAAENHVAIVDGAARVAYADLLRAAGDFCDGLEAAHVLPGDRVAVILGNQREFLVAAFGVWKRGAILMPLNPQFREAEIAGCLLDSLARVLITGVRNERM